MQMLESVESEVVEFKEAKTNYSFSDIGKYFSALSNVYITMKMYPCSGGTDTVSPGL